MLFKVKKKEKKVINDWIKDDCLLTVKKNHNNLYSHNYDILDILDNILDYFLKAIQF